MTCPICGVDHEAEVERLRARVPVVSIVPTSASAWPMYAIVVGSRIITPTSNESTAYSICEALYEQQEAAP